MVDGLIFYIRLEYGTSYQRNPTKFTSQHSNSEQKEGKMVRNGFKGVFIFVLLMTGCLLFIGGVFTDVKGQSIKSPVKNSKPESIEKERKSGTSQPQVKTPVTTKSPHSESLLSIQKVYIHPITGNLHVVIRNKKKGRMSPSVYMKAKLFVRPENVKIPWSWSLSKVDPKRSSFLKNVDFDTGKTLSEPTQIRAWIKDMPSQGEWKNTLGPQPGLAGKRTKKSMALKNDSSRRLNNQALLGERAEVEAPISEVSRATMNIPHEPPEPGSMARITGVSPMTVAVGGRLTIIGENFGATQRRVYLKLWRTTGIISSEGITQWQELIEIDGAGQIECPVSSWGNRRVVVTIPGSLASVVGEREKQGKIYIALPEYNHDIRVGPDPGSITPEIRALSSQTIRQGQTLVIEGVNFLTDHHGEVEFHLSGRTIRARVEEWDDTYIISVFPDGGEVEDIPGVAGVVKVRNHAGMEASRIITYQP